MIVPLAPDEVPAGRNGGGALEHRFLIHKRGDHVGVAVVDIAAGERAVGICMDDDSRVEVAAVDPVPLGHKIAVADVGPDEPVLEYGLRIGTTPSGFTRGAHVHTHNITSARW